MLGLGLGLGLENIPHSRSELGLGLDKGCVYMWWTTSLSTRIMRAAQHPPAQARVAIRFWAKDRIVQGNG